jgi:hypothetical protein
MNNLSFPKTQQGNRDNVAKNSKDGLHGSRCPCI